MNKEKFITIGQMAKQTGVNFNSLRYYEKLGILFPSYIDPQNGYRYYTFSQIHIVEAIHCVLSIGMAAVSFLLTEPIVGIFIKAEDITLTAMAVHALRVYAFTYLTRWLPLATQSFMSAIGKPVYATVISVSLALVFPLLNLVILKPFGLNGLWANMPLTSLFGAILAVVLLTSYYKEYQQKFS